MLLVSALLTSLFAHASHLNYPGGVALRSLLSDHIAGKERCIHVCRSVCLSVCLPAYLPAITAPILCLHTHCDPFDAREEDRLHVYTGSSSARQSDGSRDSGGDGGASRNEGEGAGAGAGSEYSTSTFREGQGRRTCRVSTSVHIDVAAAMTGVTR